MGCGLNLAEEQDLNIKDQMSQWTFWMGPYICEEEENRL